MTIDETKPRTHFGVCFALGALITWNLLLSVHVMKYVTRENGGQLDPEWLGYVYNATGDNRARIYVLEKQLGVER